MISHDRDFMDVLIETVYEIDQSKLNCYQGNYSDYLKQREENYERALAAYKNQQKEIEATEEFIDRFRNVASKAASTQSRQKQLDKLERLPKPAPPRKYFRFNFPQPPRSGQRLIQLMDIHQAYGTKRVYEGLDMEVERGERTALVGPNGAGKFHAVENPGRRDPLPEGRAQARHQRKAGLLQPAPQRHAGKHRHRGGGSHARLPHPARGRCPRHPWHLPLPQRGRV